MERFSSWNFLLFRYFPGFCMYIFHFSLFRCLFHGSSDYIGGDSSNYSSREFSDDWSPFSAICVRYDVSFSNELVKSFWWNDSIVPNTSLWLIWDIIRVPIYCHIFPINVVFNGYMSERTNWDDFLLLFLIMILYILISDLLFLLFVVWRYYRPNSYAVYWIHHLWSVWWCGRENSSNATWKEANGAKAGLCRRKDWGGKNSPFPVLSRSSSPLLLPSFRSSGCWTSYDIILEILIEINSFHSISRLCVKKSIVVLPRIRFSFPTLPYRLPWLRCVRPVKYEKKSISWCVMILSLCR